MKHSTWNWLIIGGGLHGALAATELARTAPDAEVAVLDPQPPLTAWCRRADACGMTYLRSPSPHHLGPNAGDLRAFAAADDYGAEHWVGVYRQPSRTLFEEHAASTLGDYPRIAASAQTIQRDDGGNWRVIDNAGAVHRAERIVLATGPGAPYRPLDAPHVFDADFALPTQPQRLTVIGGGLSAAQLALRAAAADHAVTWLTRERPRESSFDSDACFAGPKCLEPFWAASFAERRRQISAARHPGTLPPAVYAEITAAIAAGQITWQRATATDRASDGVRLDTGQTLAADHVILATGLNHRPERNTLLADVADRFSTGFDADGHLETDTNLQLADGLHVLGRPASLELGPMAPNIKGARLGAERLVAIARNDTVAA